MINQNLKIWKSPKSVKTVWNQLEKRIDSQVMGCIICIFYKPNDFDKIDHIMNTIIEHYKPKLMYEFDICHKTKTIRGTLRVDGVDLPIYILAQPIGNINK